MEKASVLLCSVLTDAAQSRAETSGKPVKPLGGREGRSRNTRLSCRGRLETLSFGKQGWRPRPAPAVHRALRAGCSPPRPWRLLGEDASLSKPGAFATTATAINTVSPKQR